MSADEKGNRMSSDDKSDEFAAHDDTGWTEEHERRWKAGEIDRFGRPVRQADNGERLVELTMNPARNGEPGVVYVPPLLRGVSGVQVQIDEHAPLKSAEDVAREMVPPDEEIDDPSGQVIAPMYDASRERPAALPRFSRPSAVNDLRALLARLIERSRAEGKASAGAPEHVASLRAVIAGLRDQLDCDCRIEPPSDPLEAARVVSAGPADLHLWGVDRGRRIDLLVPNDADPAEALAVCAELLGIDLPLPSRGTPDRKALLDLAAGWEGDADRAADLASAAPSGSADRARHNAMDRGLTRAARDLRRLLDAPRGPGGLQRTVLDEVADERRAQDAKWGGPEHDDAHSTPDWLRFIADKTRKAQRRPAERRRRLIQIAALAVAAVESIDRLAGRGPDGPGRGERVEAQIEDAAERQAVATGGDADRIASAARAVMAERPGGGSCGGCGAHGQADAFALCAGLLRDTSAREVETSALRRELSKVRHRESELVRDVEQWRSATACDSPDAARARIAQLESDLALARENRAHIAEVAHQAAMNEIAQWKKATECQTPSGASLRIESLRSIIDGDRLQLKQRVSEINTLKRKLSKARREANRVGVSGEVRTLKGGDAATSSNRSPRVGDVVLLRCHNGVHPCVVIHVLRDGRASMRDLHDLEEVEAAEQGSGLGEWRFRD